MMILAEEFKAVIDAFKQRAEEYRQRGDYTRVDVLQLMMYHWELEYGKNAIVESKAVQEPASGDKNIKITPLWIRSRYNLLG